jgi:glycine cleavage system H protein
VATYRYTKTHEYIKEDGGAYFLGITDHAQKELGDITYVEMPASGDSFDKGQVCCTVESVKAVAEVYAPVGFKVSAANGELDSAPDLLNKDAEGAGWILKIELTNPAQLGELMDQAAYDAFDK